MSDEKLKVVWLCEFSNSAIHDKIILESRKLEFFFRKMCNRPRSVFETGRWITNGLKEFESFNDVELFVISFHSRMKMDYQKIQINNINYVIIRNGRSSLLLMIRDKIVGKQQTTYLEQRKLALSLIEDIAPDIVHLIGAENPVNTIVAQNIDVHKTPLFISLQTLLTDPNFINNYPIEEKSYEYRSKLEKQILCKTNYLGTTAEKFREIVWENINANALFFKTRLAVKEDIQISKSKKRRSFDFVYFAINISKSIDLAIEAFAIACKKNPKITLNVVGGCDNETLKVIKNRIVELNIENNVTFSGLLDSHQDVMDQIIKSRFALLPLKIDFVSGTVREAIYSGLPVVTTITAGTPMLNKDRESVLLSAIGDHGELANNMLKLINNPQMADQLVENALVTLKDSFGYDNKKDMLQWVKVYKSIVNHHRYSVPIPEELYVTKSL